MDVAITITDDSATIGTTEYFLASDSTTATYQTTDCVLQVMLDLSAVVAGDHYLLQIYEKVPTTARLVYDARFMGVQPRLIWVSPSFVVGNGWEVSLKKIAGTDRAIAWSLRKLT